MPYPVAAVRGKDAYTPGLLQLVDMFARANSPDLGYPYSETNFSIWNYTAANASSTTGGELVTNGGMVTFTGGLANNWSNIGSGTPAQESTIVHSGSYSQKLTRAANNDRIVQGIPTVAGHWYRVTGWVYKSAGSAYIYAGTTNGNNTLGYCKVTPTASWIQVSMTFRAQGATSYWGMWLMAAGSVAYLDDVSCFEITFDSSIAIVRPRKTRLSYHMTANVANASGEVIGLVLRMDAAFQNGIVVYIQPDYLKVVIDKISGGTWSNVFSGTVATIANAPVLRVDQDGQMIDVYYNGALVTSQNVAITPNVSDWAGLFNCGSLGAHTSFAITNYQGVPSLPLYVSTSGNDANPGSSDLPKLTVGSANTKANAMNTVSEVIIGAGTFSELITAPRGQLAYTGHGLDTIIDGGGVRRGFYSTGKNGIIVRNMKVQNCTDYGVYIISAVGAIVSNVTVDDADIGIRLQSCSGVNEMRDCVSLHNIQIGMESLSSVGTLLKNCYVHTPSDPGCYGYESDGVGTDNNIYEGCWVVGDFASGFISKLTINCVYRGCVASGCDFGFYCKGATDTQVDHCVAHACGVGHYAYDNAGVAPETTGFEITSSMIYLCTTFGCEITATGDTGAAFDYNDYFGNTDTGRWVGVTYNTLPQWKTGTSQDGNSVAVDPGFTDLTYPNGFHLPAGSALLTAGAAGSPIGIDGA